MDNELQYSNIYFWIQLLTYKYSTSEYYDQLKSILNLFNIFCVPCPKPRFFITGA